MKPEILIYGLKQGETRDYMEDLLACFPVTSEAASNIEKVKAAASADGFHSFRVTGFVPGTKPNFAKAVAA
jgi:hypothetical protein